MLNIKRILTLNYKSIELNSDDKKWQVKETDKKITPVTEVT